MGLQKPLGLFSKKELDDFKQTTIPALGTVIEKLEEGTETRQQLQHLRDILDEEEINEFALAKALSEIAAIIMENVSAEQREVANEFRQNLGKFYKRAQLYQSYEDKRRRLSDNMTETSIIEHDRNLSKTIGMMYVLEYLLAIYKAMSDVTDIHQKMYYVVGREVETADGEFPGLWFDFSSDEILQKFVLDLFHDSWRDQLVEAFYDAKSGLQKIAVQCDPQGQCSASYEPKQVEEVMSAIKLFIKRIIDVYSQMGIENLTSVFLSPYGTKTKLIDLPF